MTDNPLEQFHEWMAAATAAGEVEPTRMAVATADAAGAPNVRMLLLKHADERGFVFYTNLESPKAAELRANPRASLCFYWTTTRRQVRVDGPVGAVSNEEADAYFASRPRLSQIGAWASKQSTVMPGAFDLEQACAGVALRFGFEAVPRPPFWSGFRVVPAKIEFWTEKPFRRHERIVFHRDGGRWRGEKLFP